MKCVPPLKFIVWSALFFIAIHLSISVWRHKVNKTNLLLDEVSPQGLRNHLSTSRETRLLRHKPLCPIVEDINAPNKGKRNLKTSAKKSPSLVSTETKISISKEENKLGKGETNNVWEISTDTPLVICTQSKRKKRPPNLPLAGQEDISKNSRSRTKNNQRTKLGKSNKGKIRVNTSKLRPNKAKQYTRKHEKTTINKLIFPVLSKKHKHVQSQPSTHFRINSHVHLKYFFLSKEKTPKGNISSD